MVPMIESSPVVAQAYTAVLGKFSLAPYNIPAQIGKVFASEKPLAHMPLLCS